MTVVSIALYHNIVSTSSLLEEGLGVATTPENFEKHLAYFQKSFDFIDLETLLNGPLPRKPLLLTFDDCYRSILNIARDVLAPRNIPSVLFTNPDHLGPDEPSLDNILSWYAGKYGMTALQDQLELKGYENVAQIISGAMSQLGAGARHLVRKNLMDRGMLGADDLKGRSPILTKDDLRALDAYGVEIGNHTASHVHCRSLSAQERQIEFAESKNRIEQITGKPVRSFSVPYGNEADLSPDVLYDLRTSGHEAIFLVHARSNRFKPAADVWYRTSLHNEDVSQLRRQFHLTPILRSLKHMVRA